MSRLLLLDISDCYLILPRTILHIEGLYMISSFIKTPPVCLQLFRKILFSMIRIGDHFAVASWRPTDEPWQSLSNALVAYRKISTSAVLNLMVLSPRLSIGGYILHFLSVCGLPVQGEIVIHSKGSIRIMSHSEFHTLGLVAKEAHIAGDTLIWTKRELNLVVDRSWCSFLLLFTKNGSFCSWLYFPPYMVNVDSTRSCKTRSGRTVLPNFRKPCSPTLGTCRKDLPKTKVGQLCSRARDIFKRIQEFQQLHQRKSSSERWSNWQKRNWPWGVLFHSTRCTGESRIGQINFSPGFSMCNIFLALFTYRTSFCGIGLRICASGC